MASTSGTSVAGGSAAQHIDIDDVEHGVGSGISAIATEVVDDDMAEDASSAAQAAQTPLSTNTAEAQDESDMAASFYQSTSSSSHKSQSVSKPTTSHAIVVNDQDEDDLMEPDLPGREERVSAFVGEDHDANLLPQGAPGGKRPSHTNTASLTILSGTCIGARLKTCTATRRKDSGSLYTRLVHDVVRLRISRWLESNHTDMKPLLHSFLHAACWFRALN